MSDRKSYALYLFFISDRDVILRSYDEYYHHDFHQYCPDSSCKTMWDTVYGYPYVYENDEEAVVRLTKDQFGIELDLREIEYLFDDVMYNKFYICDTRMFNVDGSKYQRITSQNYLKFEDSVDFYVHLALGTDIFKKLDIREEERRTRVEKCARRLKRMGIDQSLVINYKNRVRKSRHRKPALSTKTRHSLGKFVKMSISAYEKGKEFENKIYSTLNKNAKFNVNLTRSVQGDGGVDLILFYQDMTVFIQCKNFASKVGVSHVKEFITTVETNGSEKKLGLLISSNGFTKPCYDHENHNLILLTERDDISRCIISHYQMYDLYDRKKDLRLNVNMLKLDIHMSVGY
ncbi:3005_t:CDS:2, partial [Acaulospora morrowiae]